MKKIFLVIIFLFLFVPKSHADVTPYYLGSVKYWGIGISSAGQNIKIYQEPSINSKLLEELNWDEKGNLICKFDKFNCRSEEYFISFAPSTKTALFATDDEIEGWIKICFNQKRQLFGWIQKDEEAKYYTWNDFFITFGKKYGMYLFKDVPKNNKRLYAAPTHESECVDSFYLSNKITPWLIRGNWALVKVDHFDGQVKTGWLQYRNTDGNLLGFTFIK